MARAMKDSGVEWIGVIPAEWEVIQLKRYAVVNNGREIVEEMDKDIGAVPVYGSGGVFKYTTIPLYDGETVLFGRKGTLGKPLYVNGKIWTVDTMYYLTFTENLLAKFHYYQLFSFDWEPHITKTALPSIVGSEIASCHFAFPKIDEQLRITSYLDTECSRIDSAIEQTSASIEEYQKLKQAIITQTVTKGIRSGRAMKDSGIEWIGEIPDIWTTPKMGSVCSVITDYVASGSFASLAENVEYLDEPDYAMLVRTADVSYKGYSPKPVYINKHAYNFLHNSNLFGGELMFPNIGAVGDVYIVPMLYKRMSLAPNSIMVKTNHIDRYYYYYYQSKPGRLSIEAIAQSTAQPKFNKTDFRQLRVLLPSDQEQQEIADYLDKRCCEIDRLINAKQTIISELESYKKSLIYEYVTGKKEVPACQ